MPSCLISLLILGLIVFAIVTIVQGLRFSVVMVPQEKRIVIYKLGRVSRVAGPGLIRLMRRIETVERTIYVRDQSVDVTVSNVFIDGVPFGYRMNLWCRYDIEEIAGGDEEKLKQLALYDDDERRRAISGKILESLRESIIDYLAAYPLPEDPSLVDRLMLILPGTPACTEIITGVRTHLIRTLPTIGVTLNTVQPIIIRSLVLSKQMTDDFQRGRTITQIRGQLPDLEDDIIAQMIASIEGISLPQIERWLVEHKGDNNARTDIRRGSDGQNERRLAMLPTEPGTAVNEESNDDENVEDATSTATSIPTRQESSRIYRITRKDVDVLKPVPPRPNGRQKIA